MEHDSMKSAFLEAYDEHSQAIFRFCVTKVSDRERAQDLTQEVFMRYWQSLRNGESIQQPRAYLYRLARNLVIDWYRRKKEASLEAITETGVDFAGEGSANVTAFAEGQEVRAALKKLEPQYHEVLLLRYVEGYSPKDIAEILQTSPNVISVRIHRALKKLQDVMLSSSSRNTHE